MCIPELRITRFVHALESLSGNDWAAILDQWCRRRPDEWRRGAAISSAWVLEHVDRETLKVCAADIVAACARGRALLREAGHLEGSDSLTLAILDRDAPFLPYIVAPAMQAVAAYDALDAMLFEVLYHPFGELIPLASLEAMDEEQWLP
jgi:hypothetical protein